MQKCCQMTFFLFIQLIANLNSAITNSKGFLVIGNAQDDDKRLGKLRFDDGSVQAMSKLIGEQGNGWIPEGDDVPYGIALIHGTEPKLRRLRSKTKPYISLDEEPLIVEQIAANLVDLVVFGRHAKTDGCSIFLSICPDFISKEYLLREYDTDGDGDLSLNRCTMETAPLLPLKYQLGRPSPGEANNCEITFTPIIEMYAARIQRTLGQEAMEVDEGERVEQPSTSGCKPTPTVSSLYNSIEGKMGGIEEMIDESKAEESCGTDEGMGSVIDGKLELEQANAIFRKVFGIDIPMEGENDWQKRDHFKDEWITFVKVYFKHLIDPEDLKDPELQTWLIIEPNEENPAETIIYCRVCRTNYDEMFLQPLHKPDLAYPYRPQDRVSILDPHQVRTKIRVLLRDHAKKPGHRMVIHTLEKRLMAKIRHLFLEQQRSALTDEEIDLRETAFHVRIVYNAICKHNVPFEAYEDFVDTERLNGVEMGVNYANPSGAKRITEHIGGEILQKLTTFIKGNTNPLALTVDESTGNIHI